MGRNRVKVESDKKSNEQKEDETEVSQIEEERIEEEADPKDDEASFSTSGPRGNCCIRWRCVLLTCLFLTVILACLMLALPLLKKVVLDSLPCSPIENGDEGDKLGTNWMGRTAKQVQTKVDKGKIRTCSMYNWKRAERKEKASIYYRGGDVYKGEVSGLEGGPNAISRYVGPDDKTLPEGWGEMKYQDGSSYLGDWARGLREGCGVLVSAGGTSRYLGSWRQDRQTGWGSLLYDNGAHFKGEFVDGKFHGQGALTWPEGHTYTGQFLYGVEEGRGTLAYPDNSRYSGTWQRGQPVGRGLYTLSPGKCLQVVWQGREPVTQFVPC